MKIIISKIICFFVLCVLLGSCASRKDVVYLQDSDQVGPQEIMSNYSARIKKDDQLQIIVNCENPEMAAPFNMQLQQKAFLGGTTVSSYSGGTPQIFWVDPNGEIFYPTIGKMFVEGMTRNELADKIEKYLKDNDYIKDPIVNVTFYNYKISVLGEVNRPGQFSITQDRITLLDAIAMAGDLNIFGERDKVRIYREENGKQITYTADLRRPDLVAQPYYYLHQNDVIYVEPNQTKASNREVSSLYTFGISLTSLALTIATFIKAF